MESSDETSLALTEVAEQDVAPSVRAQLPKTQNGETYQFYQFAVPSELSSYRLDRLLGLAKEVGSRSQASRLTTRGLVFQNGIPLKSASTVRAGTTVLLAIPTSPKDTLVAYDYPLEFLYEDEDLLVVEKPSGLVVHPAYGHAHDTLVNALIHHRKNLSQGFNELRPGLVHRIDKETSGLLLIAKNEASQRHLAMQFQRRQTHRLYRALTYGILKSESGRIESKLDRHSVDRRRSASCEDGRLAVTHYKVVQNYKTQLSLVELKLETGRTHQVRVHMTELGHPLIGDTLYGGDRRIHQIESSALRKIATSMNRFFLHAYQLGFYHPKSGRYILTHTPWPTDLQAIVGYCGFDPLPGREIRVGANYNEVRFDCAKF